MSPMRVLPAPEHRPMGVGPMLAALAFRQFIQVGHLTIIDADDRRHEFQGLPGPRAVIRLTDRALHRQLFFAPQMAVGEGYRSEEHTSELQTLMRISYAVFCLQKKKKKLLP